MIGGPQPLTHEQRRELVDQISAHLHAHYGAELLALGVYGSVAREEDGPFSDIEMHCILRGNGVETNYEWSAGPWKAEVDVYSWDVIQEMAARVEGDWALTQRAYTQVMPVYDPQDLFARLVDLVFSQPEQVYRTALHDLVVGEIYELIGKLRNCRVTGMHAPVTWFTTELAVRGALLVGLAERHLFHSASRMFTEVLELPGKPNGLPELCQLVIAGDLSDSEIIFPVCDAFWHGVEAWADKHGIQIAAHPTIPI